MQHPVADIAEAIRQRRFQLLVKIIDHTDQALEPLAPFFASKQVYMSLEESTVAMRGNLHFESCGREWRHAEFGDEVRDNRLKPSFDERLKWAYILQYAGDSHRWIMP